MTTTIARRDVRIFRLRSAHVKNLLTFLPFLWHIAAALLQSLTVTKVDTPAGIQGYYSESVWWIERQAGRQADRIKGKQINRQALRQVYKQTDSYTQPGRQMCNSLLSLFYPFFFALHLSNISSS